MTSYGDNCEACPNSTVVNRAEMVVTVEKINSCVFPLIVHVMSNTKSILHTEGVRLCACFLRYSLFSRVHLEVCSPQGHNYRLRFETDLTSSPSAENQLVLSDFIAATLECFCGWVYVLVSPLSKDISFGFCLFIPKPFHWALTGGNIPPEAITVLSISQLLWSSV